MENKTNNIKTLSPETAYLIGGLDSLLQVESNIINAFWEMYGDQEGDRMYHESEIPGICESLKDNISKWLGHSISLSLGDGQRVNDNIL